MACMELQIKSLHIISSPCDFDLPQCIASVVDFNTNVCVSELQIRPFFHFIKPYKTKSLPHS